MQTLLKVRNGLVRALEWAVIIMVIVLTLDVLWGVFTRFFLGGELAHRLFAGIIPERHLGQAPYTDELACVLLVWISMFGSALAFGRKSHLGVDFFMMQLEPQARKIMAIFVQLIVLALTVTVFIIGGWMLAQSQMGQELPTMRWLSRGQVYLSLPISGAFIILFTLENLVQIIRTPADHLASQTQSEA